MAAPDIEFEQQALGELAERVRIDRTYVGSGAAISSWCTHAIRLVQRRLGAPSRYCLHVALLFA